MKRIVILIAVILLMLGTLLTAQQKDKSYPRKTEEINISESQEESIKNILKKFNPEALTAEDAVSIHEMFREKGLRGSPEVDQIIIKAGFDPEALRDLAPSSQKKLNDNKTGTQDNEFLSEILKPNKSGFIMTSSGVDEEGKLSSRYTGDGEGISMPLQWTNVPEGTKSFALNVWHLPNMSDPVEMKSYWIVYNIPAETRTLSEGSEGVGITGYNDKDETRYDPMKSKGPGIKQYFVTLYALSDMLEFDTEKVYRKDLLEAIDDITIENCTLQYNYERKFSQNKNKN